MMLFGGAAAQAGTGCANHRSTDAPPTTRAVRLVRVPVPTPVRVDRRQRRAWRRDDHAELLRLATLLPLDDQRLVRWVLESGRPLTELASVSGMPLRRIQRRLKRILERMLTPEFRFVGRLVESDSAASRTWPPTSADRVQIVRCVFVGGWTLRQTAERLGVPLSLVRRLCDALVFQMRGEG